MNWIKIWINFIPCWASNGCDACPPHCPLASLSQLSCIIEIYRMLSFKRGKNVSLESLIPRTSVWIVQRELTMYNIVWLHNSKCYMIKQETLCIAHPVPSISGMFIQISVKWPATEWTWSWHCCSSGPAIQETELWRVLGLHVENVSWPQNSWCTKLFTCCIVENIPRYQKDVI